MASHYTAPPPSTYTHTRTHTHTHTHTQALEQCIGCLQTTSNVKLVKMCDSLEVSGLYLLVLKWLERQAPCVHLQRYKFCAFSYSELCRCDYSPPLPPLLPSHPVSSSPPSPLPLPPLLSLSLLPLPLSPLLYPSPPPLPLPFPSPLVPLPTPQSVLCQTCRCRPLWCLHCMGKWFASRQDQNTPHTWMAGTAPCPMCRSVFCMLDILLVTNSN